MPDRRFALNVTYTIEFTSPFHIGTGYGQAGVVDATVVRRSDGNLYVPGASLKGRARWYLNGLWTRSSSALPWDHDLSPCQPGSDAQPQPICTLCNLFGSTLAPSGIFFTDATLSHATDLALQALNASASGNHRLRDYERAILQRQGQVEQRAQVSISRQRRVAKDELLFVTEVGQAALRFEGSVRGVIPDMGRITQLTNGTELPADLAWLIAGLHAVTQLGGRKSRGLGHCTVTVHSVSVGAPGAELQAVKPDVLLQALRRQEVSS